MKKTLFVATTAAAVLLAGCSANASKDNDTEAHNLQLDKMQTQLVNIQNQLTNTKNELTSTQVQLLELEESSKRTKVTGTNIVNASELNLRTGEGIKYPSVGLALYDTQVEVIDSNSTWFKVKIDTSKLKVKEKDGMIYYLEGNTPRLKVYENQRAKFEKLNDAGKLFVHGHFIAKNKNQALTNVAVPKNPNKPFVYGLTFYDDSAKTIVERRIWSALGSELKKKGFDGVRAEFVDRENFVEDVKKGRYDAVESAPGDFVSANKGAKKPRLIAFAKTVDESTLNDYYQGIVIINKESGINSFDDLVGRKIATGKEYSESGFKYQNYYLKTVENIDIQKQATLVQDYSHQETLFAVAEGKLDAGFVGDFVMTDAYHELQFAAKQLGVTINSEEDLKKVRDKIMILPYNGSLNPIPNNPHALSANLSKDRDFMHKLNKVMTATYADNIEEFDLTTAQNKEYDFLSQFE